MKYLKYIVDPVTIGREGTGDIVVKSNAIGDDMIMAGGRAAKGCTDYTAIVLDRCIGADSEVGTVATGADRVLPLIARAYGTGIESDRGRIADAKSISDCLWYRSGIDLYVVVGAGAVVAPAAVYC